MLLEPEPALKKDDAVFIFQHPKGRPKEYSQENILNIEKPYIYYKADTETGSSGSPVLTTVGLKLIAIHHKGSEELSYNKGTLSSEVLMHLEKGTCMFIFIFIRCFCSGPSYSKDGLGYAPDKSLSSG